MNHEQAIDRMRDLLANSLDEESRAALEKHLQECADCRSLADTCLTLQETLSYGANKDPDHPAAEEIVLAVLDPEGLSSDDRDWVEKHVTDCPDCSAEAAKVRSVEEDTAEHGLRSPRRYFQTISAMAALVLLALLIYPAYLGLFRLPEIEQRSVDLAEDNQHLKTSAQGYERSRDEVQQQLDALLGWSGTVQLQELRSTLRDSSSTRELHVDRSRPFVALGLDLSIPRDLSDDSILEVRITDSSGNTIETFELEASEARRQIRDSGILTCLVGSQTLDEGKHDLQVVIRDRPEIPALLEVPLQIVP